MNTVLATTGSIITAWSITGTHAPRVYAWMIGVSLIMLAFARWREARWTEADRRAEWNRRYNR